MPFSASKIQLSSASLVSLTLWGKIQTQTEWVPLSP